MRLNIYKPVNSKEFVLNYHEFWDAIKILSDHFKLISSSEPMLSIVTNIPQNGSPCGGSLRMHPNKTLTGCVYLEGEKISVASFNKTKKIIPNFCQKCDYVKWCQGGCLSRRILNNRIDTPDQYCPIFKEGKIPDIDFRIEHSKDYIHSGYLCTIIVKHL